MELPYYMQNQYVEVEAKLQTAMSHTGKVHDVLFYRQLLNNC